ncbi:hypothetical protein DFH28DRAFT_1081160 [Melampsora americana]|nr:hypothetical protein DFH28DRAFT_1081160 [Melampsora americana]
MSISNTMAEKFVPINDLQVEDFQERLWNTPECLPTTQTISRASDSSRLPPQKKTPAKTSGRPPHTSPNVPSSSMPQVHEASNSRPKSLTSETSHDSSSLNVTHGNGRFTVATKVSDLNQIPRAPLGTRSDIRNSHVLSSFQLAQSDIPSLPSEEPMYNSIPGLSQADIDSILRFVEGDFHGSGAGVMSSQVTTPLAHPAGSTGLQSQTSLNDSEGQTRENFPSSYSQHPFVTRPSESNQSNSISNDLFDPRSASSSIDMPETVKNPDGAIDMQTFMNDFIDPDFLSKLFQRGDFSAQEPSASITQPSSTSLERIQQSYPLTSSTLSHVAPSQVYNLDDSLLGHQHESRANFGEPGNPAVSSTKAIDEGAFLSHCIPLDHERPFTSNVPNIPTGSETQKPNADLSFLPQPLNPKLSLTSSFSASEADWEQLVTPDLSNSAAQDTSHWIEDRAMWSKSPNPNENISSLGLLNNFDQAYQGLFQHHDQAVDWGPVRS